MNNAMRANGNGRWVHPDKELLNRFSSGGENDRAVAMPEMVC